MGKNTKYLLPSLCLFAAAVVSQAAPINYTWSSDTSGSWNTRTNWDTDAGSSIGETTLRWDRVTIDKPVTVTRTGNISFTTTGATSAQPVDKKGTFNAITLAGQGNLTVSGVLRITSSSNGYLRNASIAAGSTLNAGIIETGTQNASGNQSIWSIQGAVVTESFRGIQGASSGATASGRIGGYVLNVDGGSLTATEFNWSYNPNATNDRGGELNISNGGVVNIGTMLADWTSTDGNFVNFIDGSGSLKFGYANWDLSAVNSLIADGYIRKDAAVNGVLQVVDATDGWLVTVNQIPETSTTVALFSAVALGVVCVAKRRRNRA